MASDNVIKVSIKDHLTDSEAADTTTPVPKESLATPGTYFGWEDLDPGDPLLDAYWPSRIEDDLLWHADKTEVGNWFLDSYHGKFYQVIENTINHDGGLRLQAADRFDLSEYEYAPHRDVHYCDNISYLSGAVELGELIHLPHGQLLAFDTFLVANRGTHLIQWAPDGFPSNLAHIATVAPDPEYGALPEPPALYFAPGIDNQYDVAALRRATPEIQAESASVTFGSEDMGIVLRFIPVPRFKRWTFDLVAIRDWVEYHLPDGGRVLNTCAGRNRLRHDGEIVRNDIDERRDADIHVDVAELAAYFDENSFDAVVFDPDWSLYQSNLRYNGNTVYKDPDAGIPTEINLDDLPFHIDRDKDQLGHSRLAKEGFEYLLREGGIVIELTFHGTCMPQRLGYERVERAIFDPIGEGKAVIGSVDRSTSPTTLDPLEPDTENQVGLDQYTEQ